MEHLIQLTDLSAYARPVSRHLDEETAATFITEAESLDIRPRIGDALFKAVIAEPDTWANKLLLEGGWYPSTYDEEFGEGYDEDNCDRYFKGLKSAAAYYTLARLIKGNDAQITRFGLVSKNAEYSDRPMQEQRNSQYRDLAAVGDQYLAETLAFLKLYADLYPTACKPRKIINNRTTYRVIGE